mmetsp:Transcript_4482/g.10824  ORF Transcript_4482/g.10824 Transcript_4482/m.10824 type:complete len:329 (+) Transcript_4482:191-1177(+)
MAIRNEDVAQLTSMGFPENHARNALQMTGGNVEMAVNSLLSGEVAVGNSISDGGISSSTGVVSGFSNTTSDSSVKGSTSQYTYGSDGRSACTCIALTAAEGVANSTAVNDNSGHTIMTTEFLDRTIQEGVVRYRSLRDALATSSVEHLSAEEVLMKDDERAAGNNDRLFSIRLSVAAVGGVRQGALSLDVDHPLGMKSVLGGLISDIRMERRQRSSNISIVGASPMICILITKSPETVLLCLPPADTTNGPSSGAETEKNWLLDSHPRPQLLQGVETGYAMPHDTFDSLLQSLRDIFPFTDLGPDIPPMMSDMYNMFDLYALEGRRDN